MKYHVFGQKVWNKIENYMPNKKGGFEKQGEFWG